MKRKVLGFLNTMALLSFYGNMINAQTNPDLYDMPTAENVLQNIEGSDNIDSYARQRAALYVLWDIAMSDMEKGYRFTDKPIQKIIVDQKKEYSDAMGSVYVKYLKEINRPENEDVKENWRKLWVNYKYNTPGFKEEIIENLFNGRAKDRYYEVTGYPRQATSSNKDKNSPKSKEKNVVAENDNLYDAESSYQTGKKYLRREVENNPSEKALQDSPQVLESVDTVAQSISGCDFFPNKNVVTYTYLKSFLNDKNKIEFKYIYQGNVVIEGKTYKSFNVFVNGSVPETNQVLYVNCETNSLVLGNGIYAFNRQVIGYSQNITKIVDVNATPIFEVGIVHTGDFYLPSVIKPNNAIGKTWSETNYMHGTQVSVKRTILKKNLTIEVQDKVYENVYHIRKETLIEGALIADDYTSKEDVYFAKGIGMIKTVEVLGSENKMKVVTELDSISLNEQ